MSEVTTFFIIAVIILPLALVIMILSHFLREPSNNTKANVNNKSIQKPAEHSQSTNEIDEAKSHSWAARGAGAGLVLGAIYGLVDYQDYGDTASSLIALSIGGAFIGGLISMVAYITLAGATASASTLANPFMQGAVFVIFILATLTMLGIATGILPAILLTSDY